MPTKTQNTHFSERLYYVDSLSSFVGGTACYNGNIAVSQMLWGDTTGTFAYTYDSMNRLVESRVLKYKSIVYTVPATAVTSSYDLEHAAFFRAGEVEAWGQGIERIQTYCTDYKCPAPEWRFDGAGLWTVFYNKPNPKSEDRSTEKTTPSGSQTSSQRIVELIQENNKITTQRMADILGISRRSVAKAIAKLQERGVIRRVGGDFGGHWEIIESNT